MSARRSPTTNAVDILHRRYIEGDPAREEALETERVNAHVAQLIRDRRAAGSLTQKELARLIGTTQSVISRLENADYEGHSLSMLNRIAGALDCRLAVDMTPRSPGGSAGVTARARVASTAVA